MLWKRNGCNWKKKRETVAKANTGNPFIMVRLSPEAFAKLQEVAGPSERGRGGGMALWVRRLIHKELGLPDPEVFAAELSPRNSAKRRPEAKERRYAAHRIAKALAGLSFHTTVRTDPYTAVHAERLIRWYSSRRLSQPKSRISCRVMAILIVQVPALQ